MVMHRCFGASRVNFHLVASRLLYAQYSMYTSVVVAA